MTPREQIVRAALRLLEGATGSPCPFTVTVQGGGVEVRIEVAAAELNGTAAPKLSALEKLILSKATRTPQHAKKLAAACGRSLQTHFREALRSLCRREPPLLVHGPDGYRAVD